MYITTLSHRITVILLSFFLFTSCSNEYSDETAFYVSPEGNDSWSGTSKDKPFGTLQKARDAIREMKRQGELTKPVTVYLQGGLYETSTHFLLKPEDSGTESCPITYTSYPGETAVISGSRIVSDWVKGENGLWQTSLAEVASGDWYFKTLYVNGEPRPRPRLPAGDVMDKEAYYWIADFSPKDRPSWASRSRQFTFYEGNIKSDWKNLSDIEVVSPRYWVSTRQHIASVDDDANIVKFEEETTYRYSNGFRRAPASFQEEGAPYFVENVFEALDTPGEWYLERPTGTLYYYPKPGEDMNSVTVTAPVSPYLVRMEGEPLSDQVKYITFRGLTFTQNNWRLPPGIAGDGQSAPAVGGAIYMRGVTNCAIEDCRITQLSSYGIEMDEGCRNIKITGNELGHLGGGGIRMTGGVANSHPNQRTGWNTIADNHIHHIGEIYHASTGIFIQHSGKNLITHNKISHTYYSAIAVGHVWGYRPSVSTHNEISYNHMHDIGQGVINDMGGIYHLGVAPGTVFRNNLIHDVSCHPYGYGGWGIYTDEGSSHILIENNIVYRTSREGFDQHYGRQNILRNNIFAMGDGQIRRSRMEEHISIIVERNILYAEGESTLLTGQWENKTYMHRPEKPQNVVKDSITEIFDYNLYYNPDKTIDEIRFSDWTFEEWKTRGQDEHSLYADPGFADPKNGDFTLPDDSPAFGLGFRRIDMSAVGPRKRK
jgi:parallel beta-helix repeat protein